MLYREIANIFMSYKLNSDIAIKRALEKGIDPVAHQADFEKEVANNLLEEWKVFSENYFNIQANMQNICNKLVL